MRRSRQMLTKEPLISVAFLCMVAVLPGCSAASPAARSSPAAAVPSAGGAVAFTVAGVHPVPPNGSQDTYAQTPKTGCDSVRFAADKVLGTQVADGFALAGFPAAAALLTHFLQGKGTEVDYRAGSPISTLAVASGAFRAVNNKVQKAILRQLKAGKDRVQLSRAQLPTVAFGSKKSDLYWGFRGTQGLTVTGSGSRPPDGPGLAPEVQAWRRRSSGWLNGTVTVMVSGNQWAPPGCWGAPHAVCRYLIDAPKPRSVSLAGKP